ncbi:MAG: DUF1045 domain-containing protein [Betaproteobacteria bacterium]|nr:DUF1045 domain-containing protein [Betaproteobacteria bacterium]
MNARYAIYFVPEPGTALAGLGSALLGRECETGHAVTQPVFPGFTRERFHTLTTDARRYGLHATLKAPFFLKEGLTERELLLFADCFVENRQAITLPRLNLTRLGSFFALVPSEETPEEQKAVKRINALTAEVVPFFDLFRAVPSEQEIARRNPERLSARQKELLAEWGYPYVFDEYRFHITLTDRLCEGAETRSLEENLRARFKQVCNESVLVSSICVCKQNRHDTDCEFMLLKRFHFAKT